MRNRRRSKNDPLAAPTTRFLEGGGYPTPPQKSSVAAIRDKTPIALFEQEVLDVRLVGPDTMHPRPEWPGLKRSSVAAFGCSLTARTFVCIVAIVAFAATSYRTTFDYHSLYFTPVSRKVLLDTLLELQDDGYNLLSVVRTREELDSMLTEAPRYFTFVDSGHWVAEVWIPDQFCFNNVDALISLAEDPDGTRIYLLRMEHHCPEGDDDRQKLFRIFDEKLAKRLGWEIMN